MSLERFPTKRRIGLDLLYLLPGETGGRETYAHELISAMLECDTDLELVAFVSRNAVPRIADELGERVRVVALPISARSRAQWAIGELTLVSLAARRERVELLHSMANFAPPWGPFRRVVTIHDLQYRAVPELLSPAMRIGTSALVSLAARRADRIIAVSCAGRDEIVTGLRIDAARIDVVPNGLRPPSRAADASQNADDLRERYGLGRRTVALTVATNLPHKNLPTLFAALALMPAEDRPVLLLAGHQTDDSSMVAQAAAAGVAGDVRLLGARPPQDLESLYALADCLVLPSFHEGFGLPVVEAMARSLPVACSDIPALREVADSAALYFDPRSPAQIAQRIGKLIGDSSLAERLRELGRERADAFSWRAAAQGTLASYRAALGG